MAILNNLCTAIFEFLITPDASGLIKFQITLLACPLADDKKKEIQRSRRNKENRK